MRDIVSDEAVLGDTPRLNGTRIGVVHIYRQTPSTGQPARTGSPSRSTRVWCPATSAIWSGATIRTTHERSGTERAVLSHTSPDSQTTVVFGSGGVRGRRSDEDGHAVQGESHQVQLAVVASVWLGLGGCTSTVRKKAQRSQGDPGENSTSTGSGHRPGTTTGFKYPSDDCTNR